MLEQMKSVSNPLTIIALFAALAEIAGTVAIKLVAPELQPTFIWFVMIFPTLIVVLFFVTLNFNAKVLYAPGDFKNEENYFAALNAKQSLGIEKVQAMIAEAKTEIISEVMETIPANGADEKRKIEEVVQNKLEPVQSFAGALRESSDYSLLSSISAKDNNQQMYVWRFLETEARPTTLKEIASKLNLHEYAVSIILFSLLQKRVVKEIPDQGNGITYFLTKSFGEYVGDQAKALWEKEKIVTTKSMIMK